LRDEPELRGERVSHEFVLGRGCGHLVSPAGEGFTSNLHHRKSSELKGTRVRHDFFFFKKDTFFEFYSTVITWINNIHSNKPRRNNSKFMYINAKNISFAGKNFKRLMYVFSFINHQFKQLNIFCVKKIIDDQILMQLCVYLCELF
jgi:hypothetical protein